MKQSFQRIILFSYSDFYLISFNSNDAAFVIAIPCSAWTADNCVTSVLQFACQFIDPLPASNTKGNMGITCAIQVFFVIQHARFAHYFQSCPAIKTDEIGAKTRILIVIAIVGTPFKIVYEEISRFFQFVHI